MKRSEIKADKVYERGGPMSVGPERRRRVVAVVGEEVTYEAIPGGLVSTCQLKSFAAWVERVVKVREEEQAIKEAKRILARQGLTPNDLLLRTARLRSALESMLSVTQLLEVPSIHRDTILRAERVLSETELS